MVPSTGCIIADHIYFCPLHQLEQTLGLVISDCRVQFVNVNLVMLVVVQCHCLLVKVRLKCITSIRERRQLVECIRIRGGIHSHDITQVNPLVIMRFALIQCKSWRRVIRWHRIKVIKFSIYKPPADIWNLTCHSSIVPLKDLSPMHNIPPSLDVLIPKVPVKQVICMFPDINSQDWDAGIDEWHQRVVLVGCRYDLQFSVFHNKPCKT
mmetsp:Transcript_103673/g.188870  ORF Transcript_103673/g.188870 Transcript_103673/m.188870 type:complete len:209 (+) Transcript_103673:459-1085(+)